jgi:RNA polymerase sigma-70 factor (ECF subfamily)
MTPETDNTEAQLLERLRRGDARAFEELVRENLPRMLAVARRLLWNEEDAQEAVQEAFLSAYKALPKFQGGSKLSTWLHRIVANAALMKRRAKSRRPEVQIESLLPRFEPDGHRQDALPAWTSPPLDGMAREETRQKVRFLIQQLPEDFRNVILLRDIEGMDTAGAAAVLEISEAAVKTRLHRARQALRTLLEKELTP